MSLAVPSSTSPSLDVISPSSCSTSCMSAVRWQSFHQRTSSGLHHASMRITATCARILSRSSANMISVLPEVRRRTQCYQKGESTILCLKPYSYLHRNMVSTYKRFLVPEIFFNPEIYFSDFLTPLLEIVDGVIQASPIDVHRGLYKVYRWSS